MSQTAKGVVFMGDQFGKSYHQLNVSSFERISSLSLENWKTISFFFFIFLWEFTLNTKNKCQLFYFYDFNWLELVIPRAQISLKF